MTEPTQPNRVERIAETWNWQKYQDRVDQMETRCDELLRLWESAPADIKSDAAKDIDFFYYHLSTALSKLEAASSRPTPEEQTAITRSCAIGHRTIEHYQTAFGEVPTKLDSFQARSFFPVDPTDAVLYGNIVDAKQNPDIPQEVVKSFYASTVEGLIIDQLLLNPDMAIIVQIKKRIDSIQGKITYQKRYLHQPYQIADKKYLGVVDQEADNSVPTTQVAGNRIVVNHEIFEARGGAMEATIHRGTDLSNLQGCTKLNLRVQNDRFEELSLPHDLRELTISSDDPNCIMQLVDLPVNHLTTDHGDLIRIIRAPHLQSLISPKARTLDLAEAGSPQLQDVQAPLLDELQVPRNINYQRWRIPKFQSLEEGPRNGNFVLFLTNPDKVKDAPDLSPEAETDYGIFLEKLKEKYRKKFGKPISDSVTLFEQALINSVAENGGILPFEAVQLQDFWHQVNVLAEEDDIIKNRLSIIVRNTFTKMLALGLNYQAEFIQAFSSNFFYIAIVGVAIPDNLQNLSAQDSALYRKTANDQEKRSKLMEALNSGPLELALELSKYQGDEADEILSDPYVRQFLEKRINDELYALGEIWDRVAGTGDQYPIYEKIELYKILLKLGNRKSKAVQWHAALNSATYNVAENIPAAMYNSIINQPSEPVTATNYEARLQENITHRTWLPLGKRIIYDHQLREEAATLAKAKGLLGFRKPASWALDYKRKLNNTLNLLLRLETDALSKAV